MKSAEGYADFFVPRGSLTESAPLAKIGTKGNHQGSNISCSFYVGFCYSWIRYSGVCLYLIAVMDKIGTASFLMIDVLHCFDTAVQSG